MSFFLIMIYLKHYTIFIPFYNLFVLKKGICLYNTETTWPSGLRRVTRNHFSSGGVGSNPAVVVFIIIYIFLFIQYSFNNIVLKYYIFQWEIFNVFYTCFYIHSSFQAHLFKKRWSHPGLNWGPKNQNLTCYHYTMEPYFIII